MSFKPEISLFGFVNSELPAMRRVTKASADACPADRNYTGPTRGSTEFKTSSMKTFTRTAAQETHNAALDLDDDSHSRMFVSDTRRTNFMERDMEDSEVTLCLYIIISHVIDELRTQIWLLNTLFWL